MTEILARITPSGNVELVTAESVKIRELGDLSPFDAAYLARGMIACAAALSGANPPSAGTLGGDAHLPILRWVVGTSRLNGEPVSIFSIPSRIELTFQLPAQTAGELGAALIAQAPGSAPPAGQSGTVH